MRLKQVLKQHYNYNQEGLHNLNNNIILCKSATRNLPASAIQASLISI